MTLRFISSLASVSRETAGLLGGARLGDQADGAVSMVPFQRIVAPLLGAGPALAEEAWLVDGPLAAGETEGIRWRQAGELLYGVLEIDEADFAADAAILPLQAASQEAYRRIFRLIDAHDVPNLWRIWNYLPEINRETGGLERYRQFNIGRQDAFLAYRHLATGNVPAACALGVVGGRLSIAFLASARPAMPIENPRQVSAYNYPADYGPRSPTFSRAALARLPGQDLLFISGTASIVGHQTVHVGDVGGQCRESMANIATLIDEANRLPLRKPFALADLSYRVYVRFAHDFPAVQEVMRSLAGSADIIYIQADICRADLMLEIEAYAAQEGGV